MALNAVNRAPFDFDGDGKTDVSIFSPGVGEWWYLKSSDGGNDAAQFGSATDTLVPADYTGDGKIDAAVFRPSTNIWCSFRSSTSATVITPFGVAGDKAVPNGYVRERFNLECDLGR